MATKPPVDGALAVAYIACFVYGVALAAYAILTN